MKILTFSIRAFSCSFVFAICLILSSFSSFAQIQIPVLNEATDELTMGKTMGIQENEVELSQKGFSNQVIISQDRPYQFDLPNQAILNQDGLQNMMKINQSTSNGLIVAKQDGDNNTLDVLVLEGENLNLTTFQQGSNNKIKQTHIQSVDVNLNLIQQGDNHTIEQTYNNQKGLNMTIIQKGQNAALRVIHN
ncbi:MAG: hypothetical protein AB8F94_15540 [Saprospiraceae bacterium]